MRHAHAASGPSPDAERPLTPKGAEEAGWIGRWLADQAIAPDAAAVSSALRARQSWERVAAGLRNAPTASVEPRLYQDSLEEYLEVLAETDNQVQTLMIVGHNPSVAGLASTLYGSGGGTVNDPDAPVLPGGYPPGALAVFDLSGTWAEAETGTTRLVAFVVPPR